MQCIILCGGLGTRLGRHAGAVPKPMAPIGGRPVLEHLVGLARDAGIRDVVLLTGHLAEQIEDHFGDGSRLGVRVHYFREPKPLGTAGGIKAIEDRIDDDFLVLYGDVMMCFDVARFIEFHRRHRPLASLVVHPNDHPYDSDLVELDDDARIVAVHSKPHEAGRYYANLVNAGAYLFSPGILAHLEPGVKCDFGRDVFPRLVGTGRLFGYNTPEYLKDMGTPERYDRVDADWAGGKIERMHLRNPRPAIFLDRDGVINRHVPDLGRPEQFELLPGAADAIRRVNQSEFLCLVVTNQPAIAKGLTTPEQVAEVHRKMETLLGERHAKLDAIAFCPHHPARGFPGEVPELKVDCECRKPGTGMVRRLAEAYHVDLARSYLIGDSGRDLQCAVNAGMTPVGVRTGEGCRDVRPAPSYLFEDLAEAVAFLLEDPYREVAGAVRDRLGRAAGAGERPLLITVAGQAGAGKTVLAEYLARDLTRSGRRVARRHLDARPHEPRERLEARLTELLASGPGDGPTADADVLIAEGPALPALAHRAAVRIWCAADEAVREDRLHRHGRWGGMPPERTAEFIRARRAEEARRSADATAEADLRILNGRLEPR
jgi:histidinol-phosphate phosphatase family protein